MSQLLEEARPDRPRPDEAHVAAQDVPELRDLVELGRAEPAADRRHFAPRPADELGAEMGPQALLGVAPQRAELDHVEDAPGAADALPAVEDRPSAREGDRGRDQEARRQRYHEEERGEDDVERSNRQIDAEAPR